MKKLLVLLWLFSISATAATVSLVWDKHPDPAVVGYNIYRSTTPGGPYTKLNLTLILVTDNPMYTDTTPTGSALTYYYVVRAATTGGAESSNSNEVVVNPPPTPPTNLRVVSFSAVNLLIDGNPVATGPPPLNFILPRQMPPRLVPIAVTVAP